MPPDLASLVAGASPDTGTPPTGRVPPVPAEGTAARTAAEDMVIIQMPRRQLQTVVEAFRQITSLLEDAAAKADTDIQGAEAAGGLPGKPGTMKPESSDAAGLAADIEGMRKARG